MISCLEMTWDIRTRGEAFLLPAFSRRRESRCTADIRWAFPGCGLEMATGCSPHHPKTRKETREEVTAQMDLSLIFSQIINGLQTGSVYALVALGYSMVYGIILLLNFAHGDIIMVGAYTAFYAIT